MPIRPDQPLQAPHPPLKYYYRGDGEKSLFIADIFNRTAENYDRVERLLALGSGQWYRRHALARAGLARGMRVLDVATGTGLVAAEEIHLGGRVIGLDPSIGMLRQARQALALPVLLGRAEQIPCPDGAFDFVSMGYALRHVSDLEVAFREFWRVLKPGGTLCILEITPPAGRGGRMLLRLYMKGLIPWLTRLLTRDPKSELLMRYYWDTIEACVEPEKVLTALCQAGFKDVRRHVELGIFSEYVAVKDK